jgi:hypothetical protein
MDQFRNDVALWVNKLRGRYDAIFIEPENVNKSADPNLFTLATASSDQPTKTRLTTSELTAI